ncbi:uncharacterized protein DUF4349 [Kribbella voronezhensis]|uniref:Uncharacterized protein DUF4349 n=1 Tax=Kribbella voronezhensis TaxID=2512212 RepID=A0A4R7TH74_9ACTN|nr:DUF4349 domain-containing protein [Kribbella voronezhensis]TDU91620.1 uncharacterized protein DUF4349 [Kribbella voronezhensis]
MTRTRFTAAVAGVILTAAVLLSGCSGEGGNRSSGKADSGSAVAPEQAQSQADGATADGKVPAAPKSGGNAADQPTVTRAIIKTGSLSIEADDVDAQRQKAIGIVTGLNGQVVTEDSGSDLDGGITRANLTLKVPTAQYETAIQRLSGLGKRTAIHQESTDATEAVVDVASRISTQRAGLERMRALLAKATTIGEIVSVESELTRRESDLEALLAKQKALAGQTELATLNLVLSEPGKAPPAPKKEETGFLAGLKGGWNAFAATVTVLLTALGALLPFLVVFALIGIPLWRYRHRFRRTPATAPATGALPPAE